MTDIDHAKLRELAQAATSAPWGVEVDGHGGTHVTRRFDFFGLQREIVAEDVTSEDAEYIAAASPDVVLALLDEIDRLCRSALGLAGIKAGPWEPVGEEQS